MTDRYDTSNLPEDQPMAKIFDRVIDRTMQSCVR